MENNKEQIYNWFNKSSMNEDDILSLELISLDSSSLNIRSGEENLIISLIDTTKTIGNRFIVEYHGDDDFFKSLVQRLNTQLTSSINIIEILDKLCEEANILYSSMEQDENYDDNYKNEDDEIEMNMDYVESKGYELINDLFRPISREEEVKLKQKLMEKINLQAALSSMQASSLATPTVSKTNVKSIFSEGTSSMILINEFLSINRLCREDGIIINAIDDNVFSWRVRYYKFKGDSDLSIDLISLDEQFG